jgi:hypothetical protein
LEIEQLKSKILDLESQKNVPRPIEVTQSQNIEDLKKQIEGSEADTKKAKRDKEATELKLEGKIAELAAAILKISALEEELKMKKPLFDVGVKVRCGFLQSVKRVWVDGYYVTTHPPLDVKAIWEKNEAVHRGNYEADKALFDLKIFQTTPEKPAAFHYAYDIDSGHNLSACPKALTLVNYRGTLMACGFLTKYTHSKAEDDRAKKYFDECKSIWLPIFSSSGIDVEKQKAFENDTSLTAKFKALRTITEETVKKEQKRLSG